MQDLLANKIKQPFLDEHEIANTILKVSANKFVRIAMKFQELHSQRWRVHEGWTFNSLFLRAKPGDAREVSSKSYQKVHTNILSFFFFTLFWFTSGMVACTGRCWPWHDLQFPFSWDHPLNLFLLSSFLQAMKLALSLAWQTPKIFKSLSLSVHFFMTPFTTPLALFQTFISSTRIF